MGTPFDAQMVSWSGLGLITWLTSVCAESAIRQAVQRNQMPTDSFLVRQWNQEDKPGRSEVVVERAGAVMGIDENMGPVRRMSKVERSHPSEAERTKPTVEPRAQKPAKAKRRRPRKKTTPGLNTEGKNGNKEGSQVEIFQTR